MNPGLRVRAVLYRWAERIVVSDVSLDVAEGEMRALFTG